MKKNTLIALLGLVSFTSGAQSSDTAFAAVRYTFVYLSDTSFPVETENMVLYLGKTTSEYRSTDRVKSDSILKEQIEQISKTFDGHTINLGVPGMKRGSGTIIYKDNVNRQMQRVENFNRNYLIDDSMPGINWNISTETKNISELNCQKATATFKGRNYTAWFAAQLPYNDGPWKLCGLPGLIVEAYDDQQQVVFKFAGYEDISSKHIAIGIPGNIVKTTDMGLQQLKEAARKNPQGIMMSRKAEAQSDGGSVSDVSVGGYGSPKTGSGAPPKRRTLNNPIERTPN